MNETLKTITGRYSCRDFAETPLTDEQIKTIVEAALAAPSAKNGMPWQIIVVTDKALIEEMDKEGAAILTAPNDPYGYSSRIKETGGKVFYNAPCMVMIARDDSHYASLDCGILAQNVALAAHSLGLASVICGLANIPLTGPRGDEFKKRLKYPDNYKFGMSVLVGTAKSGKEPHELDMSKVTYVK